MKSLICVSKVEKRFTKKHALFPLTFTIEPGSCVALCGGNGAGKSTLLYILAGIQSPDSGRVSGLEGYSFGFMPDTIRIPSGVSGRRWLQYLARLKQVPEKQVDEVLQQTGLREAADRDAASYSRGMLQRLLFAQMILGNPDLLIMDEPGNGLDPFWIDEWKKWIKAYKDQGKTILFSSHLLRDVLAVSDRVLLLHEGQLLRDETVDQWLEDPLEPEERFLALTRDLQPMERRQVKKAIR